MKSIDQALLASLDLVFAQDPDGRLIYINEVTARTFGHDRHHLAGQLLSDTQLPSEIIQRLHADHQEILTSGRPTRGDITLPVIYQDVAKSYEYTFSPVRGRQGAIDAAVFIAKDITDRKQAETALQASEAKYRSLFEAASDVIFILDASSYHILNANWAAARQLGYSRQELLSLSIQDIEVDLDDVQRADIIQQIEIDGSMIYEHRYRRKNGSEFPVEIIAQLIEYDDQLCIQSFVRDITERKQSEEHLRQQQQQIESIAANFPGTIYREIVHPDGTVSIPYVSEGDAQFNGLTPEQIMENPLLALESIHPEDRPDVEAQLHQSRQTLQPLDVEYRNIHPTGKVSWLREIARFFRNHNGEVVADGVALDVTARKEAQQALERQLEQERLLRRITQHIHRSLDLETILQTTADSILDYLSAERVMVCRFTPEGKFDILVQSTIDANFTLEGSALNDCPCLDKHYIEQYEQGHGFVVGDIYHADVPSAFTDCLAQLQVRSHLNAPILISSDVQGDSPTVQLWGLVIAQQCSHAREWESAGVEFVNQLATQLGIAVYQAELLHQLQTELQERIRAEEQVRALNAELEQRVNERTLALQAVNHELVQEIRERIQTAEALRQSVNRFRDLVETTSDLVWEEDAHNVLTYISPQSISILGYTPYEMIGRSVLEFVVPEQRPFLEQETEHAAGGRERAQHELRFLHKDGHEVILESNQVIVLDESGQFIGSRGIDRDITERKHYEETLRRYERIFSATQDGMSLVDRNYRYQVVNQIYVERSGGSIDEIVGHSVDEFFEQEICERVIRPNLDRCFMGEVVQYGDWFEFPNAGQRFISVSYSPYIELDGSVAGAVVSTRDITELKQVEAALEESERRFRAVFESAHDAFVIVDDGGRYIEANPVACELFGATKADLLTSRISDFLEPDIDFDQAWQMFLEQGEVVGETRLIRPDGTIRDTEFVATAHIQNHQHLSVLRDVTERKQMELALRESEAQLRQIFDNAEDILFLKEIGSGQLIYRNSAWSRIFQQSTQIANDASDLWLQSVHPEDYEPVSIRAQQQKLGEGGFGDIEYRIVHPDGSIRWMWNRTFPICNEAGEMYRFAGITTDITEHKRTEETLRIANQELQAIFEALPDVYFRVDWRGTVLDCRYRNVEQLAVPVDELEGKNLETIVPPDVKCRVQTAIAQAIATDSVATIEYQLETPDRVRYYEARLVGFCHNEVIVIVRDISSRKHAELALATSETRLRTLIDALPFGVWVRNAEDRLVLQNPIDIARHGNRVGTHVEELEVSPEVIDRYYEIKRCCQLGDVISVETTETVAEEDRIFLRIMTVLPEHEGTVGMLGVVIDVTELKRTREALQISEERLRVLINALPFGVWVRDASDRLILQNAEDISWHGHIMGTGMDDSNVPQAWRDPHEDIKRRCRLEGPIRHESTELIHGEERTFLNIKASLPDLDGSLGMFGVAIDITERKQIEAAMARQLAAIEAAVDGIAVLHGEVYLSVNQAHLDLFGYESAEEIVGDSWKCLYSQEEVDRFENEIFPLLERDRAWRGEAIATRKDGSSFHEGLSLTLTDDGLLICVCRDVSDRKRNEAERQRAEAKLREREQFLRSIYENAHDGIFVVDVMDDGDFRYYGLNPSHERLSGLSTAALRGKTPEDIMPPAIAAVLRQNYQRCLDSRQTITYEECLPFHGKDSWWLTSLVPLMNEAGQIFRILGTTKNITDIKSAEVALKESQILFRALFEQASEGIAFTSSDHVFLQANQSFCELFGYSEPELRGLSWRDLTHPDDCSISERNIQQLKDGNIPNIALEKRYIRKNTSVMWADTSVSKLQLSPDQSPIHVVLVRDISRRKRLEVEREQVEQALANSEERLQMLINVLPFGIWVRDADDRLILQNPENIARYGYSIGSRLDMAHAPRELLACYERTKRLGGIEAPAQYESTELIHGEERIFLRINGTLPDLDGSANTFGVSIDVTERRQIEALIRKNEERFRLVFENAKIGVVMVEPPDFTLHYVNPYFQDMLGYSAEELKGMGFEDITYPDDLEIEMPLIQECRNGDRTHYQLEKRYIRKDKRIIWVNLTVSLVKDEAGQIRQGVCVVEEITVRKRNEIVHQVFETALRQTEARQRLILDVIPDLMSLFSYDGTLLDIICHDPALNLVSDPSDAIGKHLTEIIPTDLALRQTQAIQQVIETREMQVFEQQVVLNRESLGTPNEQIRHEEVRIVPADDNTALILVRDISDRKTLEESLRRSQSTLQDILDNVDASIIRFRICDRNEPIIKFVSAACETVFGYRAQELMLDQSLWRSRIVSDDLETIIRPSWQRLRDIGSDTITYRFRCKDGKIRHIVSRAIAHQDDRQGCWFITSIETIDESLS